MTSCVINRTTDFKYARLIHVVHQLAQAATEPALPYLGFQILKLEKGQGKFVRPDDFKCPDVRSLIQVAQTEHGRSEVSCIIHSVHRDLLRAQPMILTDDSRPSHFTVANQVGVQTDDSDEDEEVIPGIPEELHQTIGSHLWLRNLEVSAAITPRMVQQPLTPTRLHPDGPATVTRNQLLNAQLPLDQAHQQRDITQTLKGVVTNMLCLARFSQEAGSSTSATRHHSNVERGCH